MREHVDVWMRSHQDSSIVVVSETKLWHMPRVPSLSQKSLTIFVAGLLFSACHSACYRSLPFHWLSTIERRRKTHDGHGGGSFAQDIPAGRRPDLRNWMCRLRHILVLFKFIVSIIQSLTRFKLFVLPRHFPLLLTQYELRIADYCVFYFYNCKVNQQFF